MVIFKTYLIFSERWKFILLWNFVEDVVDRICEIHFHTIKNKKVECKKAQPKETVTPATQLQLQKRLLLSGLGLRMPTAVVGNVHQHANVVPASLSAYPLAAAQVNRNLI